MKKKNILWFIGIVAILVIPVLFIENNKINIGIYILLFIIVYFFFQKDNNSWEMKHMGRYWYVSQFTPETIVLKEILKNRKINILKRVKNSVEIQILKKNIPNEYKQGDTFFIERHGINSFIFKRVFYSHSESKEIKHQYIWDSKNEYPFKIERYGIIKIIE